MINVRLLPIKYWGYEIDNYVWMEDLYDPNSYWCPCFDIQLPCLPPPGSNISLNYTNEFYHNLFKEHIKNSQIGILIDYLRRDNESFSTLSNEEILKSIVYENELSDNVWTVENPEDILFVQNKDYVYVRVAVR